LASQETLESKRKVLLPKLLTGPRRRLVGRPKDPWVFKPAVRAARPYSGLATGMRAAFPIYAAWCAILPSDCRSQRAPRSKLCRVCQEERWRFDRMADPAREKQLSRVSRPDCPWSHLAAINGCRSRECGDEEESRHDRRDRLARTLERGVLARVFTWLQWDHHPPYTSLPGRW